MCTYTVMVEYHCCKVYNVCKALDMDRIWKDCWLNFLYAIFAIGSTVRYHSSDLTEFNAIICGRPNYCLTECTTVTSSLTSVVSSAVMLTRWLISNICCFICCYANTLADL